jgi:CHAT domain-containing protein
MCGRARIVTLTLAIALSCHNTPTFAQAPATAGYQPRDWAGRPTSRTCRASVRDLSGLHAALVEHERAKIGFEGKFDTGWFYGNRLRNAPLALKRERIDRTLHRIQENLRELSKAVTTGILVYDAGVQGRDSLICAWLVTKDGVQAAEIVRTRAGEEANLGRLAQYSQSRLGVTALQLTRAPRPRGLPRENRAIAAAPAGEAPLAGASSILLPPVIQKALIDQGIKRLLILPVADISTVPFYALPLGDKALLDFASVVVLPDTNALFDYAVADRTLEQRGRKLIIGNPDSSTDELEWDSLASAEKEAGAVNELTSSMSGHLLLGFDARKQDVIRLMAENEFSLIYFATHGLADSVNPVDGSFLLLSKGRLLAREIGHLQLRAAPLVVMSACQSGLGKTFEGGMFGLARAWRKAGAGQVVMSLWDVYDEATNRLMVDFMGRVLRQTRPEEALREAMLKARDEWGFSRGQWSGFAMFGFATR